MYYSKHAALSAAAFLYCNETKKGVADKDMFLYPKPNFLQLQRLAVITPYSVGFVKETCFPTYLLSTLATPKLPDPLTCNKNHMMQ